MPPSALLEAQWPGLKARSHPGMADRPRLPSLWTGSQAAVLGSQAYGRVRRSTNGTAKPEFALTSAWSDATITTVATEV